MGNSFTRIKCVEFWTDDHLLSSLIASFVLLPDTEINIITQIYTRERTEPKHIFHYANREGISHLYQFIVEYIIHLTSSLIEFK